MESLSSQEVQLQEKLRKQNIYEFFIYVILSFVNAILCGIYTGSTTYYEGEECKKLHAWGRTYFYFLIILSMICLILCFLLIFSSNYESHKKYNSCSTVVQWILFLFLAGVIFGLDNAYEDGEPCGTLREFVYVTLILYCILLGIRLLVSLLACLFSIWIWRHLQRDYSDYNQRINNDYSEGFDLNSKK